MKRSDSPPKASSRES